ncbi:MAG: NAD(P)-dependent oxidoreductase [Magnetococcus sp. DMHC-8]
MRLFMTGSNSFIGQVFLDQCDARGVTVTGVDLTPSRRGDCHVADIRDPGIAERIPEGVDAVVHLAALSRDGDCRDNALPCFSANVLGTLNLMAAARARQAKQFIFASSEWVYDRFENNVEKREDDLIDVAALQSEYALSKLVSEVNLRQQYRHGFCPVTILRFGIIYGPRRDNWSAVESLLNGVATREEVTVGALATSRRFVYVTDIADAVLAAVGHAGFDIFNIQGSRSVTLGEVIETSKALLGKTPRIVESAPATPNVRLVSGEKAKRLLGWEPRVDLETGLRQVARLLDLELVS